MNPYIKVEFKIIIINTLVGLKKDLIEKKKSNNSNTKRALAEIKRIEKRIYLLHTAYERTETGLFGICCCCGNNIDEQTIRLYPERQKCSLCKKRNKEL